MFEILMEKNGQVIPLKTVRYLIKIAWSMLVTRIDSGT